MMKRAIFTVVGFVWVFATPALGAVRRVSPARVTLLFDEDGVVVQLFPDLVLKLQARQLEQPDRLLQLGRHDQLLCQA